MYSSFGISRGDSPSPSLGAEVSSSYISGIPDINQLNNPRIIVVFKGLLKRDSITKEKALTELLSLLTSKPGDSSQGGSPAEIVDSNLHWAWVQLYPKLSIDVSRTVRASSHEVQGVICSILKRQAAKHMKYSIGPWIAGTHDPDKSAAHSATGALDKLFPTAEKRAALFKAYEGPLLDYIYEIIAVESVNSLSDDRFVSKEQAEDKYNRVQRCCIATFSDLLNSNKPTLQSPNAFKYSQLIDNPKIWKACYSKDLMLSRTCFDFISNLVKNHIEWAQVALPHISISLIQKALSSSVPAASTDLLQALIATTRAFPQIWTIAGSTKHPPLTRLCTFFAKGSQYSSRFYWPSVLALLSSLPKSISPYIVYDSEQTEPLLPIVNALLAGASKEPVHTSPSAWGAYLTVVEKIVISKENDSQSVEVIRNTLIALGTNIYLSKDSRKRVPELIEIIGRKISKIWSISAQVCNEEWSNFATTIFEEKDIDMTSYYLRSTQAIMQNLSDETSSDQLIAMVESFLVVILESVSQEKSFSLLCIQSILEVFGTELSTDSIKARLNQLVDQMPLLLEASSVLALSNIFKTLAVSRIINDVQKSTEKLLDSAMSKDAESKDLVPGLLKMTKSLKGLITPIGSLSQFLGKLSTKENDGWLESLLWGVASRDVFISRQDSGALLDRIIVTDLINNQDPFAAIKILSKLSVVDNEILTEFVQTELGNEAVSALWKLSESSNDTELAEIENVLDTIQGQVSGSDRGVDSQLLSSLVSGFLKAMKSAQLEDVVILVQRGQRLLDQSESDSSSKSAVLEQIVFGSGILESLDTSMFQNLSPSLSISNPLGGAVFKVATEPVDVGPVINNLAPVFIIWTSLINSNEDLFAELSDELRVEFIATLLVFSEFAVDALYLVKQSYRPYYELLSGALVGLRQDVQSIVSRIISTNNLKFQDIISSSSDTLSGQLLIYLSTKSGIVGITGFYHARAHKQFMEFLIKNETLSSKDVENYMKERFQGDCSGDQLLPYVSSLKNFDIYIGSLNLFSQARNRYASNLIGISQSDAVTGGLGSLIILNLLLEYDEPLEPIPPPRLGLVLKTVTDWLFKEAAYSSEFFCVRIEVTKLLTDLLAKVQISEAMFENILSILVDNLTMDTSDRPDLALSLEYFSLRLLTYLQKVSTQEEYAGSWKDYKDDIYEALLKVYFRKQPAVNEIEQMVLRLCSQTANFVPLNIVNEALEDLYLLLSTPSLSLQKCGFSILHRYIPSIQEERSIELELNASKISSSDDIEPINTLTEFSLPVELISLVLDPPSGRSITEISSFLFSWKLIFDNFENTTYRLRQRIISELRAGGYVDGLLDFIAEKVVNNSSGSQGVPNSFIRYEVYSSSDEPTEEFQILTHHLYYSALHYMGSLVKGWFLSVKKRNISLQVETFTGKYMSPVIVDEELDTVERALQGNGQVKIVDETMDVFVVRPSREVRAVYHIDDQNMEIIIRIPSIFPLRDLSVDGVRRVGARENQWRAWILASQSIVTLQNGSILDALELFKKNVSLHFEGLTECAICYSILHQDRSLPTKVCATCKNKFHSDCLYKWFKSASASTCPLCRSTFSFRVGL